MSTQVASAAEPATATADTDIRLMTQRGMLRSKCSKCSPIALCAAAGWFVALVVAVAAVAVVSRHQAPAPQPSSTCIANLGATVDKLLNSNISSPAVSWGVHIVSEHLGELVAYRANHTFTPASNNKLLTASAALTLLGPQHKFVTSASASVSTNSLCVAPAGDPSLDDEALHRLAAKLRAAAPSAGTNLSLTLGVAAGASAVPSSWEVGDLQYYYGATPGPAIVNENVLHLWAAPGASPGAPIDLWFDDPRDASSVALANDAVTAAAVSSFTLHFAYEVDPQTLQLRLRASGAMPINAAPHRSTIATRSPERLLLAHLANATATAGLTRAEAATTRVVAGCEEAGGVAVSIESPPAVELLNHTLLVSDNLYAEAFLRAVSDDGSASGGIAAVRAALTGSGGAIALESASGWVMADGCGLSRHNLVAPAMLTSLLRQMKATPLPTLLPTAGRTGTLAHRMVATAADGRCFAKTGTMSGVSALSGYLDHPDQQRVGQITFSIIANNSPLHATPLRDVQDAIVVAAAEARVC